MNGFVARGYQVWETTLSGANVETIWKGSGLVQDDCAAVPTPNTPGMVCILNVVSVSPVGPTPVNICGGNATTNPTLQRALIPGPLFPGQTVPMRVGTPVVCKGVAGDKVKFEAFISWPDGVTP